MKATISAQSHRVLMKITELRLTKIQDIDVDTVNIKATLLATHWCKTEIQNIEGIDTQVEVSIPFSSPIIYDEFEKQVPFDLWVGIRKAVNSPEALLAVNEALLPFSALFTNSMEGFTLQLDSVEMA